MVQELESIMVADVDKCIDAKTKCMLTCRKDVKHEKKVCEIERLRKMSHLEILHYHFKQISVLSESFISKLNFLKIVYHNL